MMTTLNDLLAGLEGVQPAPVDIPVQSVVCDSRRVTPGAVFVAIPGTREDGTQYLEEATRRGAAALLLPSPLSPSRTPLVTVPDSRRALSWLAANFYAHPSKELTVIGITGTNGKTTTSYLIRSVLEASGETAGVIGTLGTKAPGVEIHSSLTTPDSIELQRILRFLADGGVRQVVMEVSSHSLELDRVADIAFDVALFTNLTQDHLDFHGSMDNYFQAKLKLFRMLGPEAKAVLNLDDPRFPLLKKATPAEVITYGVSGKGQVTFREWGMSVHGIHARVVIGRRTFNIASPLTGIHNLENLLAAVAACHALGVSPDAIQKGIAACTSVPGRMETFSTGNGATVIMDYAHTPDAYHKLFSSLRRLLAGKGRLRVIFGCGGDRDRSKRPLMARAAETYADLVYVTPDNPRSESLEAINAQIAAGFEKQTHTFFSNRAEAIHTAIRSLDRGDILAVVGKGRDDYQQVGMERLPHSDADCIEKAIREN